MKLLKMCVIVLVLMIPLAVAEGLSSIQPGMEAPDFEVTTLEGDAFILSENRGKVVLLNIWATWCPPCVSEMPDIQRLSDAHPDDLTVIGVSVDDSSEEVAAFVAENGLTYNFAMDENYLLAGLLYPTEYIPESVFINPSGIITSVEVGTATYAQLEYRFQQALDTTVEQ